jgi:G3E family GTPase
MPGYGFAYAKQEAVEAWKVLIQEYLQNRTCLKRVYVIVDARHGIKVNDREFLETLDKHRNAFQVVLTKCDLVLRPVLAKRYHLIVQARTLVGYISGVGTAAVPLSTSHPPTHKFQDGCWYRHSPTEPITDAPPHRHYPAAAESTRKKKRVKYYMNSLLSFTQ